MKHFILLVTALILVGCNSTQHTSPPREFDYMPDELTWTRNIADCRSAPVCRAESLFNRF